ncbi:MAG: cysteine desulfurase [Bacteroidetes bacterium]|nr:cysteine desulfurase [Bacteroidota bacterium]
MTQPSSHIYLDYSATTPLDPAVADVIRTHQERTFGNASSVHRFGRQAKVVLEESRERIAQVIGCKTAEIFFTSGGTESDNHALIGTALHQRRVHGRDHVAVSAVEHHAVLDAAEYLATVGFTVDRIPVDSRGFVDPQQAAGMVTDRTAILSVMHANNETGAIQPLPALSTIARTHGVPFHSDTVQTVGKLPVHVDALGTDIITMSAHKIYGPKGVGAIYIRQGTGLDPLLHGGAQERNNRAGTENVPLIAGFAEAMELAERNREALYRQAVLFRDTLYGIISGGLTGIIRNSDPDGSLPHILSVSLDASRYQVESEALLLNMDLKGVAVSSGSACTSGSIQPSHVLLAMGRDTRTTAATVRFSFGKFTTIEEVRTAGGIFCSIVRTFPVIS